MPLPRPPSQKGSLLARQNTQNRVASTPPSHKSIAAVTALVEPVPQAREHTPRIKQTKTIAPVQMAQKPAQPTPKTTPQIAPIQARLNTNHNRSGKTSKINATRKLFVLDTNVMLHDPSCFFRFEEHDVYLPLVTLEELDNHKKGTTETARHGRQVSRTLDRIMGESPTGIDDGVKLGMLESQAHLGRLFFQTEFFSDELPKSLPVGKADNQILGVVHGLQLKYPNRSVVLVSKDINMRIKARALGLNAEDYFNDQVIQDQDILYSGQLALPIDFWDTHGKNLESWTDNGLTHYRIEGPLVAQMNMNQFVFLDDPEVSSFSGQVVGIDTDPVSGATLRVVVRTLLDYTNPKHGVWGIGARNREQNFALNVLMNPDIDFVTLLGQAGTGKTLVTIAAALQQTLETNIYSEVIITRITVPVGEDIGFLPGTEEEKMTPWMGALQDNLEILIKGDANAGEWARAATNELIKNKVKIKAMSFMRGRTFVNKLLILDEAQNLTPKQMKTLITRAGPGTKVVCMGNLAQIDTPYLTEGSSGLAYAVEHFKGWAHSAHITLVRGERSRLADYANEVL